MTVDLKQGAISSFFMRKKFRQKVSSYLSEAKLYFSDMNSNKVTAIATSVIAISLLGFIISIPLNKRHEAIKKACKLIYGYGGGDYSNCVRNPSKDIKSIKNMFMDD